MIELPSELIIFYTLALSLLFGKFFEELISRTKYPPVLGDILAGLIIGASVLGIYIVTDTVKAVAWFGVAMLLFYAGLETKYGDFIRLLPVAGLLTIGEALAAFSMGFLVGMIMGYPLLQCFFLGAILEATSVSLTIRTLMEIGKLSTIEGYTIMEIAVLDDLSSLITIAIGVSIIALGTVNVINVTTVFIKSFGAWALLLIILHRLAPRIVKYTSKLHVEEAMISVLIAVFAGAAVLVGLAGISPLVGAYATGLALSEAIATREVRSSIRKLAIIFSTVFFVTTAAELDLKTALRPEYLGFYLLMIAGAFAGKMLGAGLTSLILGFPVRSALRICVGLFPRCEFAIIAAYTAVSGGVLGVEAYLAALIIVLTTNVATPPLLKMVFAGEEVSEVKLRFPKRVITRH
ncbi:cation:proton antiporter [Desulfurococcaceae archaeon MEX13E-LK6-19]|nr:cation:proton antiporter [Desulfurococcaceae archaeon MEX13E-LK6-19]